MAAQQLQRRVDIWSRRVEVPRFAQHDITHVIFTEEQLRCVVLWGKWSSWLSVSPVGARLSLSLCIFMGVFTRTCVRTHTHTQRDVCVCLFRT